MGPNDGPQISPTELANRNRAEAAQIQSLQSLSSRIGSVLSDDAIPAFQPGQNRQEFSGAENALVGKLMAEDSIMRQQRQDEGLVQQAMFNNLVDNGLPLVIRPDIPIRVASDIPAAPGSGAFLEVNGSIINMVDGGGITRMNPAPEASVFDTIGNYINNKQLMSPYAYNGEILNDGLASLYNNTFVAAINTAGLGLGMLGDVDTWGQENKYWGPTPLVSGALQAPGMLSRMAAIPLPARGKVPNETLPFGARGPATDWDGFDEALAGGPVRNFNTDRIKVTNRGIEVVEKHTGRFGTDEANQIMIDRLKAIDAGKYTATQQDLNFYSHELREYVRYRKLGWEAGVPSNSDQARQLWLQTHTATLDDYNLPMHADELLYHPDALKALYGE